MSPRRAPRALAVLVLCGCATAPPPRSAGPGDAHAHSADADLDADRDDDLDDGGRRRAASDALDAGDAGAADAPPVGRGQDDAADADGAPADEQDPDGGDQGDQPIAVAAPTCVSASDCGAGEPVTLCRSWTCVDQTCVLAAAPKSAPCGPASGCLQPVCGGEGACDQVQVLACPNGACAIGVCQGGACALAPQAVGAPCDDGDACTAGDHCDGAGACAAGLPAACSATACAAATCDPLAGCGAPAPLPAGATCSDGDLCTVGDACDGAGACAPGPALPCAASACVAGACPPPRAGCLAAPCDDANACTLDGCAPSGACLHFAAAGAPCSDGAACTQPDLCAEGACSAGPAVVCPAAGPCVAFACAAATGACEAVALAGPCTASGACVVGAACQGGACVGGQPLACDDGLPCTEDACALGACAHTPVAPGVACGAGRACGGAGCACALGVFVAPHQGLEWLRAVAATSDGFAAVGASDAPGSARGLLLRVDFANSIHLVRRYGDPGKVTFAALAPIGASFAVAATLAGPHAAVLRLDALGNVLAQTLAVPNAEAQALAPDGEGGLLVLATDDFGQGAATRLVRLNAALQPVWAAALAPTDPATAARAHAMARVGASVLVVGQDLGAATGAPSGVWLRAAALTGGLTGPKIALPAPPAALALALVSAPAGLAMAGTSWLQGGSAGARWSHQGAWPTLAWPNPALVGDSGAWTGVAVHGGATFLAGWRVAQGGQASIRRLATASAGGWELNLGGAPAQALHALTPLADGSLVAVGSRDVAGGSAALWVRWTGDGALTCP